MTDAGVSRLTDHLGFWLRMVSNHVSHGFARRLDGCGVTVAEWVLMRELYGTEPMAPSRLADRMGMTRGAISKLSDRLIAKGLVCRVDDPSDGRAHTLSLTGTGTGLVPDLARLADENEAEFFASLTDEERRVMESALRRIVSDCGLTHLPVE
ncbi:MarR family winged helix-turn-helix transcriptional regulator [Niveispirillum sp.]|uniref:MarR family winged helix-turn-helix transcriptional regulator n=1 Tax=Niveispirillum sp. TaxID=1917217 RepID=UPI001B5AF112|nr:MarR family transcriptional regulator [Niveispirillum sp.]MBP7339023.1 MarR family transcriptional regulator [Niveispirillum sp.]